MDIRKRLWAGSWVQMPMGWLFTILCTPAASEKRAQIPVNWLLHMLSILTNFVAKQFFGNVCFRIFFNASQVSHYLCAHSCTIIAIYLFICEWIECWLVKISHAIEQNHWQALVFFFAKIAYMPIFKLFCWNSLQVISIGEQTIFFFQCIHPINIR